MTLLRSLSRAAVVVLALFVCIFGVGTLSRQETLHNSPFRLSDALSNARDVGDECKDHVAPGMRAALITYLAVEDYFRPPWLRRLEFWLASAAARLGIRIIGTLGVGQISLEKYLEVRAGDPNGTPSTQLTQWISDLQSDCANVSVLRDLAQRNGLSCVGGDSACAVLHVCFWHTGKPDSCREARHQSYLSNIMIAHSKVVAGPAPRSLEKKGSAQPFAAVDDGRRLRAMAETALR